MLVRCRSGSRRELACAVGANGLLRAWVALVMTFPIALAMAQSDDAPSGSPFQERFEAISPFRERWDALTRGSGPSPEPGSLLTYPATAAGTAPPQWPELSPARVHVRAPPERPVRRHVERPKRSVVARRPAVRLSDPSEARAELRPHRRPVRSPISDSLPASLKPTLPPDGSPR
jgi:hypothetical protein